MRFWYNGIMRPCQEFKLVSADSGEKIRFSIARYVSFSRMVVEGMWKSTDFTGWIDLGWVFLPKLY
jgi:hypothetical protein